MTYKVPSEIAVALSTGRMEFLDVLITRLEAGEAIPDDSVEDLVRFCVDLVKIRLEDAERMRSIQQLLGSLRETHDSVHRHYMQLVTAFKELDKDLSEFESSTRRDH